MNDKVKELFENVKSSVKSVAVATGKAAQSASKKAGEFVENTKLNLKLFDLNTDIEAEYKEIGKLVYKTHLGEDVSQEMIEEHLALADKKNNEINEIKARINTNKNTIECDNCGSQCSNSCIYCPSCGNKIQETYEQQHVVTVEPLNQQHSSEDQTIYESDDDTLGN